MYGLAVLIISIIFVFTVFLFTLFFRGGPYMVPSSYEPNTLLKSLWGVRPLKKEILDHEINEQEKEIIENNKYNHGAMIANDFQNDEEKNLASDRQLLELDDI